MRIAPATAALALTAHFCFGAPVLAYALTAPAECRAVAEESGLNTRWTFWRDCQTRDTSGAWVKARREAPLP